MPGSSGSGASTRSGGSGAAATGDYWALPPPGHPAVRELISASDIGELARRLGQAERRHGL